MSYKPILFNSEMVRAILDGRKTQTRRIVKPQPKRSDGNWGQTFFSGVVPYTTGDILWVRETWHDPDPERVYVPVLYKADFPMHWDADQTEHGEPIDLKAEDYRWKPSIHMPKGFARIFLRVKDVRVERLRQINEEDAIAEGVPDALDYPINHIFCPVCNGEGTICTNHPDTLGHMDADCHECNTPTKRFRHLWNSTVKPGDRFRVGWEGNPWVWVIEFERIEKPEGWCS